MIIHKHIKYLFILLLLNLSHNLVAQMGEIESHDPSTIQKDGNTFWFFSTGNGIKATYSSDLENWKISAKTVFQKDSFPNWIKSMFLNFRTFLGT